jgi:hypothetical protein
MKDEIAERQEVEGLDWVGIVLYVAVIMALVLGAVFAHYEASRAQGVDPMPVLVFDSIYMPQVTK